ncbi:MAG: hypothetical protein ACKOB4_06560 [Acidobacteriota bacterium]
MNDTALATLQRTLSENREAKRKMLARLAEIESESASLRSQLASLDAVIERTEQALLQLLFPVDRAVDRALQNQPAPAAEHAGYGLFGSSASTGFDDPYFTGAGGGGTPGSAGDAAIDAELARLQQQTGNVRFNDFRIPQAATIVLREANRALHVSEIYRRMAEGGFEFRGQHQLISLAVSLSRSKRFRKVAPGTFELNPDYQAGQVA